MNEQKVILSMVSVGRDPKDNLKKAVRLLNEFAELISISSVYRPIDQKGSLGLVTLVETNKSPEDFTTVISELRSTLDVICYVLLFDGLVQLNPDLPIPHPELRNRAEWLVPASELWPDAIHPVLKKTLAELVSNLEERPWGEFVAQGKSLLDF